MNDSALQERQFSSMHTHTIFCDGKDDVETMCRAAYEKKLAAIGFSAHAPIEKQTGLKSDWNLKEEKVEQYVEAVLAAKKRWQGKLDVYLGYEVDYIKGKRSPLDNDIKALNLDYIIGSVHYIFPENGAEPFTVDGPSEEFEKGLKEGFNSDAQALMNCYYDALSEMITQGGFDILGHADIIKKNCIKKNYWKEESEACRQKEIASLTANVKDSKIIFEVNTGGINRKKIDETYPSLSFLRIIKEFNIPVIITSDAHCSNDINGNYNIAIKTLVCADYKEHMLFKGKSNNIPVWKKEII